LKRLCGQILEPLHSLPAGLVTKKWGFTKCWESIQLDLIAMLHLSELILAVQQGGSGFA
jgi:hypothetical protein